MWLPCRRTYNEKIHNYPWLSSFPSCGPFGRVAYLSVSGRRIVSAARLRPVLDPSIIPLLLAVSLRGNLAAGLSSSRRLAPPRLPYRWAGSCVGRDGGRDSERGANAIDGMRRKNRFEFLLIADKLSKTPLLRRMRGRHIFHTVPASIYASIPFFAISPA